MSDSCMPVAPGPAASQDRPAVDAGLALAIGLGIVLCQILVGCLLSGQSDPRRAYAGLACWDSGWYGTIVDQGYVSPPVLRPEECGNVVFFPAYPTGAWLVRRATGLPTRFALLLTAQLAAWGFWTYLLLFLRRRLHAARAWSALAVLLIASHPAAFYLVTAYSESLFLCALLGFLYWSSAGSARGLWLAALHGFLMTATRLVGLPVVAYPLLHAWLNRPTRAAHLLPALAASAAAALGCVAFFLYCHVHFGQWDLYMRTARVGWGTSTNPLAFFSRRIYYPRVRLVDSGSLNPVFFSQLFVPLTLLLFVALLVLECRRWGQPSGRRFRIGLYLGAALMFYVSVCGNSSVAMYSMVRYLLCVEVLLVLAVIHRFIRDRTQPGRWLRRLLAAWVVGGFVLQLWLTYRFTHALWVA